MSYNFFMKKARIRQKIKKMLIYKYSTMFLNTYPGLFGRIDCREECWQYQRLVKIIEYFTASSDCFRMSYCFWRKSSGIFCAFISEGRMFSKLERQDPTTYKGKDYVITSNSFIFHMSNGSQDAATRSITRSAILDLGGTRNSFWKWRFVTLVYKRT